MRVARDGRIDGPFRTHVRPCWSLHRDARPRTHFRRQIVWVSRDRASRERILGASRPAPGAGQLPAACYVGPRRVPVGRASYSATRLPCGFRGTPKGRTRTTIFFSTSDLGLPQLLATVANLAVVDSTFRKIAHLEPSVFLCAYDSHASFYSTFVLHTQKPYFFLTVFFGSARTTTRMGGQTLGI